MKLEDIIKDTKVLKLKKGLLKAACSIYEELRTGESLVDLKTSNASNDTQIALDVFADDRFKEELRATDEIKYYLSEESPAFLEYGSGELSLALDPLDGSKSAMVGIPSGSIFGIFKNVDSITDLSGKNILASGFFVYGINLEVYLRYDDKVFKGTFVQESSVWRFESINFLPKSKMIAINASNKHQWEEWLQEFYEELIFIKDEKLKPFNMRWYASMVTEVKRLIIQGGLFAYPSDRRKGYENGHLRAVYEAIPMAYLIRGLGGASSDGEHSLLDICVSEIHQKTPVFLGNKELIEKVEQHRK